MPSPETPCAALDERIHCFAHRGDEWQAAAHPLHQDKPAKAGVGMGITFARELLTHLPDDGGSIGLIPCAFGGSELERWEEGPKGDLFDECVRRVKAALSQETTCKLGGILWHQGESDASVSAAATYTHRLPAALDALRSAVGGGPDLPLVVGELLYAIDQTNSDYAASADVNAAIVSMRQTLGKCGCASASGLGHNGDRLHFDSQAQVDLGRRYASEMIELMVGPASGAEAPVAQPPFSFPSKEESAGTQCEATIIAVQD